MNVLFICTQNLQRSPTAERVYKEMCQKRGIDINVKSAGTSQTAETRVSKSAIRWADRIYVMEEQHKRTLNEITMEADDKTKNLNIPDMYWRDQPELIKILKKKLKPEIPN